jgi:hypothetical protein
MVLGTFLLCGEDSGSIVGRHDDEAPELGRDLGLSGFARLQLESDELVGSLMAKEREQLTGTAARVYLERLNNGGLELSCRTDAINWICKVTRVSFLGHISCLLLYIFPMVYDVFVII